jgi:hypothetical protein
MRGIRKWLTHKKSPKQMFETLSKNQPKLFVSAIIKIA